MKKGVPALLVVVAALGACVPYPAELLEDERPSLPKIASGAFPGLDPGASDNQSLHFRVSAYGPDNARAASELAEEAYRRIMTDTGLYSFQPHGLYQIVIYGSRDEYRKKTGQPQWSAGMTLGNAIYTHSSARLGAVLSHEIAHLIWHEFMNGRVIPDQRWVNEGLAVYEESKAANGGQELFSALKSSLRSAPLTIAQLRRLPPASERAYDASLWYAQAEDLVRFMIERGGQIGFSQFLTALQYGKGWDEAVAAGFPGQWRTLDEFETAWKAHLVQ
ncbi:MAG: hypothetical protein HY552_05990 [Elusimicrobia bacterium]|nr:hypothetical protein [Elusimicrobiota bacterium]